jgi:hypothetical protein
MNDGYQVNNKLILFIYFLTAQMVSHYAYSLEDKQSDKGYQVLKESIQALNITRNKSIQNKSNLNKYKDSTQYHEYSVFIEFLSYRIDEYCSQISELYDEKKVTGLPCSNSVYNQSYKLDKNSYVTSEEKIESLDDELMKAIGDFDEMLLEEDEKIAQIGRKKIGNESNSSGQYSQENNSDASSSSEQKNKNQSSNSNNENQTSSSDTSKMNKNNTQAKGKGKGKQGGINYERRKLNKTDDDIVARQLKEAAENESNPELKEKLWNEYYKYKQNKVK